MRNKVIELIEEFIRKRINVADRRPFYSEADLQHSLAVYLAQNATDIGTDTEILLEYLVDHDQIAKARQENNKQIPQEVEQEEQIQDEKESLLAKALEKKNFVDIVIRSGKKYLPIEVKYFPTGRALTNGIPVKSKSHKIFGDKNLVCPLPINSGGHNLGCFGTWKDVERNELLKKEYKTVQGISLTITNDSQYWRLPVDLNGSAGYREFSLKDGRKVKSTTLEWGNSSAKCAGYGNITIKRNYTVNWKPELGNLPNNSNELFRYIIL